MICVSLLVSPRTEGRKNKLVRTACICIIIVVIDIIRVIQHTHTQTQVK